jgi:hypothetical protein
MTYYRRKLGRAKIVSSWAWPLKVYLITKKEKRFFVSNAISENFKDLTRFSDQAAFDKSTTPKDKKFLNETDDV